MSTSEMFTDPTDVQCGAFGNLEKPEEVLFLVSIGPVSIGISWEVWEALKTAVENCRDAQGEINWEGGGE